MPGSSLAVSAGEAQKVDPAPILIGKIGCFDCAYKRTQK
jgi:hypothetical protein